MSFQAQRIKKLIHKTLEDMKKYPNPCVERERLEQNLSVLEKALLRYEPKKPKPVVVKKPVEKKKEKPVEKKKEVVKKEEPVVVEKPVVVKKPVVKKPVVTVKKEAVKQEEGKQEEVKQEEVKQEAVKQKTAIGNDELPLPPQETKKKVLLETGKIEPERKVQKVVENKSVDGIGQNYNLEYMKVEDLRKLVTQNHLFRGISRMKKEELIKGIRQSEWWRKGTEPKKTVVEKKEKKEKNEENAKASGTSPTGVRSTKKEEKKEQKKDYVYNPSGGDLNDVVLVKMSRSVYEKLTKK